MTIRETKETWWDTELDPLVAVPLVLVGNIVVASFAWWLVGLIVVR